MEEACGGCWSRVAAHGHRPSPARIGRVTTDGKNFADYGNLPLGACPQGITVGPDQNIWFSEGGSGTRARTQLAQGKRSVV
jgi:streptogramin lyase